MRARLPREAGPAWRALRVLLAPFARAPVRHGIWIALFVVALGAIFASAGLAGAVDLRAGEIAPFTVTAPTAFVDRAATLAAQAAAMARVRPVYAVDPVVAQDVLARFDAELEKVETARLSLVPGFLPTGRVSGAAGAPSQGPSGAGGSAAGSATAVAPPAASATPDASSAAPAVGAAAGTTASRSVRAPRATASAAPASARVRAARALCAALGPGAELTGCAALLAMPPSAFDALAGAARAALQRVMAAGVRPAVLGAVRAALARQVAGLGRPAAAARLLAGLDARLVVPDQFLDGPATDAADAAARQAVPPVVVAAGQVIVRQGQRVTAGDLVRLREAGLLPFGGRYGVVATSLLLAAFVAALALAFLGRVQRRASGGERELLLFGAVFCGTTAAVRFSAPLSPFLAPVTWAALLVAIAFGPPSAVFTAALGGLVAGLLDHSLAVALVATASAWTGVFALRRPEQRTDLLRAGLWAALGGAAIAFLVGVFGGQDPAALAGLTGGSGVQGWQAAGAAALSGFLSGALAVGTLPLLEALGVLTPFRLLELCNPAQPLLRRLMLEAPGTYHHSLMVANLAEAACEAVGGDALLARAGAYYHDVGKVKRPYFFVENQFGGVNPHEGLSPQLSALVIRSHVRDGVELAQQARLPAAVVDFIRTHHARTRVGFFQQQAMAAQAPAEEAEAGAGSRPAVTRGGSPAAPEAPAPAPTAGGSPADEEDPFRYPGPLPETRETAVVMLADAVEAAVRASGGRSDEQIRATVDRVVATRLAEGQLDRAELTLRDVDRIKATFRRILAGAYHARIEYPSELQASAAGRPGAARGGRVLPLPGRGGGAAGPRHGHGAGG